MRKLLIIYVLLVFCLSCKETTSNEVSTKDIYFDEGYNELDNENIPLITFDENDYNFGIVIQGEAVKHIYKFTNTGKSDLLISNVSAECGCTTPKDFSRDPIKPGEKGEVLIEFDSTNKLGQISKEITILTNSIPPRKVVTISGEVMSTENLIKFEDSE